MNTSYFEVEEAEGGFVVTYWGKNVRMQKKITADKEYIKVMASAWLESILA